jgi:hypothetical protein
MRRREAQAPRAAPTIRRAMARDGTIADFAAPPSRREPKT